MKRVCLGLLLLASLDAEVILAHHSVNSFYDLDNIVDLKGRVLKVRFANPHVKFTLEVVNDQGEKEIWQLETRPGNALLRIGLDRNTVNVGQELLVAGTVSRLGKKNMFITHLLLDTGEEILLLPEMNSQLRWSTPPGSLTAITEEKATMANREADGIFRVWSTGHTITLDSNIVEGGLPYTEVAMEARRAYNPLIDDTALQCISQGMPGIMDNPSPFEFRKSGDDIELIAEEWDTLRTIHMVDQRDPDDQAASLYGYSVGHWEEDVLVVETSRINWPLADDSGTPKSEAMTVHERFILSEDEQRLDYEMTIIDAYAFKEPVHLTGYWTWVPGEIIRPYNCRLDVE